MVNDEEVGDVLGDEIDTAWILKSACELWRDLGDWGAPPEPIAIHEIVTELNAQLGATVVAALSGTRSPGEAGETHPDAATEMRLRVAHQLWHQVAESKSPDVARTFFTGSNPELGDDTLITALREDRFREAWAAVRAFATDT